MEIQKFVVETLKKLGSSKMESLTTDHPIRGGKYRREIEYPISDSESEIYSTLSIEQQYNNNGKKFHTESIGIMHRTKEANDKRFKGFKSPDGTMMDIDEDFGKKEK